MGNYENVNKKNWTLHNSFFHKLYFKRIWPKIQEFKTTFAFLFFDHATKVGNTPYKVGPIQWG